MSADHALICLLIVGFIWTVGVIALSIGPIRRARRAVRAELGLQGKKRVGL